MINCLENERFVNITLLIKRMDVSEVLCSETDVTQL